MSDLLSYLQQYSNGILIIFLILLGIAILAHYTFWLLAWGRFQRRPSLDTGKDGQKNLSFVAMDAAFKLVNDFRHLLALILVVVFSSVLIYAAVISQGNIENLKNALQAVMATLGGLVASIIGYYFGEQRSINQAAANQSAGKDPVQNPPAGSTGGASDIKPAPPPPGTGSGEV